MPPRNSKLNYLLSAIRLAAFVATFTVICSTVRGDVIQLAMTIDGSQPVPATDSIATGSGTATLDTDTNLFSYNYSFNGLEGIQTAVHFHGPAPLCETAAPQITLPLGSPVKGQVKLSPQQASDVLAGLWYLNIHSDLFPPGEVRAQIVPAPLEDPLPPIETGMVHIKLEIVATGLTAPNWGTSAPGDSSRLFVCDQDGILWAIDLDTGTKTEFLNVTDQIVELGVFGPDTFDERGLLGVAFHPNYQKNGLLYTYTSEPNNGAADFSTIPDGETADHQAVIREWMVPDPGNPDSIVDPKSTRVLMKIDEPQFNHNAGAVNFGPDGMLYFTLGDGGGADDRDYQGFIGGAVIFGHGCRGNGSDPTNILGTVVRIDPLGNNSSNGQYGIPKDNPFVGGPELDEIYAYGFRNPFRFSFDSATGDLYLADVGQHDIEEVNLVVSGGDYGWNYKEGTFDFIPNGNSNGYVTDIPQASPGGFIDPITQYDHDDGIAVIGGFVYRGIKIPALTGMYVYGDWSLAFGGNNGRLFYYDGNQTVEFSLIDLKSLGMSLQGFGQDADGEIYILANTTGTPFGDTGVVMRIVPKLGDLDADGVVGTSDLLSLLASWGTMGSAADLDMDGIVGTSDLLLLLANWG